MNIRLSLLVLLAVTCTAAQEKQVDPTWLHRFVPSLNEVKVPFSTGSCHYKAVFGEGDSEQRILRSVSRFGVMTVDPKGACRATRYDRDEELYVVLEGTANLHYGDRAYPLRTHDFSYIGPRVEHSVENPSGEPLQVVVMGFHVPAKISIDSPTAQPTVVNMDGLKEQTVDGHPTSVLYKLLVGPRNGRRDAIDQAYIVTSLFSMDFAPGGTNFPHHHETAEEIYFVVDGNGDMVAGGGMDGIAGRHPARAGDAYYFRANCTVGFYNQNTPGAQAHILAVRSRIPLSEEQD